MKKKPIAKIEHPLRTRAVSGREFAVFPVAIFSIVIHPNGNYLLFHRASHRGWESPSGALEEGEMPLAGLQRELREELGPAFRYRILGLVHAGAFAYDRKVPHMLSIGYAVKYTGGPITPGDDMAGAVFRWMSHRDIRRRRDIEVPSDPALYARARALLKRRPLPAIKTPRASPIRPVGR